MAYKPRTSSDKIEFISYVNITLDKDQIGAYKKWRETTLDIWSEVDRYTENGYRVSVSYDTMNKCIQASIVTNDPKNDNAGYIMTGRGSTAATAIAQAIYKDTYVAQGNWKAFANSKAVDWD